MESAVHSLCVMLADGTQLAIEVDKGRLTIDCAVHEVNPMLADDGKTLWRTFEPGDTYFCLHGFIKSVSPL